jgi:hypothetical protein
MVKGADRVRTPPGRDRWGLPGRARPCEDGGGITDNRRHRKGTGMDGSRFDALARSLAGGASRRGFVGRLLGLGAGLAGIRATAAACPPGRVSSRGRCLCRRTGRPPTYGICPCPQGQTDTGDGRGCLACRADGDCDVSDGCTDHGCVNGACATTTQANGTCCPAGRCQGGACASIVATLTECGGRCDCSAPECPGTPVPATLEVCGIEVTCPSCADCAALGCPGGSRTFFGPAAYCVAAGGFVIPVAGSCPPGTLLDPSSPGGNKCKAICQGAA